MWKGKLRVAAEPVPIKEAIRIYFYEELPDDRIAVLTNMEFTTVERNARAGVDFEALEIPIWSAQELMDSLWDCHLRPSEGSGSAGALRAVEHNRDDLKEIVERLMYILEKAISTRRQADG